MKSLFRIVIVLLSIVFFTVLLLVGGSESADAAEKSSLRFSGKGSQAGWTTCPGEAPVGEVCTDTFIFAAEELFREDGSRSESSVLSFRQSSYMLTEDGSFLSISDKFGFTEDFAFSINNNLSQASVVGDVLIQICTAAACEDDGFVHVDASWTGQGNTTKNKSTFSSSSKVFKSKFQSNSTFRDASAVGQVDGESVGSLFFANLFSTREASMTTISLLSASNSGTRATAEKSSFSFSGNGAQASWTTCPEGPTTGVICTDTSISAAEELIREDGSKSESSVLSFGQSSYTLTEDGDFLFISQKFGSTEIFEFSIDNKLSQASATGDVPIQICTDVVCEDAGSVHVEASWIGQGDKTSTKSTFSSKSKEFKSKFQSNSTFRDASAVGQVDGDDMGSSFFGSLFNTSNATITLCRAC